MKRYRRNNRKKQVRIIVFSTIFLFMFMSAGYAAISTNITLHAKGNIKERSKVIKVRDETAFWQEKYRTNIVNISFLDTNSVPNNAAEKWDISDDGLGGVMAWVTINHEDTSKYDLFIGAKDGVVANENSSRLFNNFSNTVSLNFSDNFDTSNTITMYGMFNLTTSLKELDLSNFNTNNVTNMGYMFASNHNIETINVSSFDTSKVTNMDSMFAYCLNINELDLSSFDTTNVSAMNSMFFHDYKLSKIYSTEKFITSALITHSINMFDGDTKLIGGNGTTYDSNHLDNEYARIDTASTPGYFTQKT